MSNSPTTAFRILNALVIGASLFVSTGCDDDSGETLDAEEKDTSVGYIDSEIDEDAQELDGEIDAADASDADSGDADSGDEDSGDEDSGDEDSGQGEVCQAIPFDVRASDENHWKLEKTFTGLGEFKTVLKQADSNAVISHCVSDALKSGLLFSFTVPATGFWTFSTENSKLHLPGGDVEWDSVVVLVKNDCQEVMACNDDAFSLHSEVGSQKALSAGELIYIYIANGSQSGHVMSDLQEGSQTEIKLDLVLTAQLESSRAPTIDTNQTYAQAMLSRHGYVAVNVGGTFVHDIVGMHFRLEDANDKAILPDVDNPLDAHQMNNQALASNYVLPEVLEDGYLYVPFLTVNENTLNNQFKAQWAMYTNSDKVKKIRIAVRDRLGNESDMTSPFVFQTISPLSDGKPCGSDPLFHICGESSACLPCSSADCADSMTCQFQMVPSLLPNSSAFVQTVNPDALDTANKIFGFKMVGTDADQDVIGIEYRLANSSCNLQALSQCLAGENPTQCTTDDRFSQCFTEEDLTACAGANTTRCLTEAAVSHLEWTHWYRTPFTSVTWDERNFTALLAPLVLESEYQITEVRVYDAAGHYASLGQATSGQNFLVLKPTQNAQSTNASRLLFYRQSPDSIISGNRCDPAKIFSLCQDGDTCLKQASGSGQCVKNDPPAILFSEDRHKNKIAKQGYFATTPENVSVFASLNNLGYEFSVVDEQLNVEGFYLQVFNQDGAVLTMPGIGNKLTLTLAEVEEYGYCEGEHKLWVKGGLYFDKSRLPVSRIAKVKVQAFDSEMEKSSVVELNKRELHYYTLQEGQEYAASGTNEAATQFCQSQETVAEKFLPCDRYVVFNTCARMLNNDYQCRTGRGACGGDADYNDYYCLKTTAPSISRRDAYYNEENHAAYIYLEGYDEQCDVSSLELTIPGNSDGTPEQVISVPLKFRREVLTSDTTNCSNWTTTTNACYQWQAATWFTSDFWSDPSSRQNVRYRLVDAEGLAVQPELGLTFRTVTSGTVKGENEGCDPLGAKGRCAEGLSCVQNWAAENLISAENWWICTQESAVGQGASCPIWNVKDLAFNATNADFNAVQFAGNTEYSDIAIPSETCHAGGPAEVWHWKADKAGSYLFTVQGDDSSVGNPLLMARSTCVLESSLIDCDLTANGTKNSSSLELDVRQNQDIYLFVSGYHQDVYPGFYGRYTLSVQEQQ